MYIAQCNKLIYDFVSFVALYQGGSNGASSRYCDHLPYKGIMLKLMTVGSL